MTDDDLILTTTPLCPVELEPDSGSVHPVSDITAFLAARLEEDERAALWPPSEDRELREVTAKRAIIAAAFKYEETIDGEWGDCHEAEEIAAGLCSEHPPSQMAVLRQLATIWSDHPGYDPTWKP